MNSIDNIFNRLLSLKENGVKEEFSLLLNEITSLDLNYVKEYVLDIAFLLFENEEYKKALLYFKKYLEDYKDEEIVNAIIDAYYKGNEEIYIKNYKENCKKLDNYKFYYGEGLKSYEEINCLPLWNDDDSLFYIDMKNYVIVLYKKLLFKTKLDNTSKKVNNELIIYNDIDFKNIIKLEKETFKEDFYYNATKLKDFIHTFFEKNILDIVLCINNIEKIFIRNRICIYTNIDKYLSNIKNCTLLYNKSLVICCINSKKDYFYLKNKFEQNYKKSIQIMNNIYLNISNYYNYNKDKILYNIINRKPKILLMVSNFTTIIKYHIYYLYSALKNLGIESYLLTDDENNYINTYEIINTINIFKPDIFITINSFKEEILSLDNLVFLTWLQDIQPLNYLKNKNDLYKNNFILNHFITDKQLLNNKSIDLNRLIDAPICSDENIYRKYVLTDEEKLNYSCDICIVANTCDVYSFLDNFEYEFEKTIFLKLIDISLSSNQIYLSNSILNEYLDFIINETLEIMLDDRYVIEDIIKERLYLIKDLYIDLFNYRLLKINIVDTLINAGFTNIKLWGREWLNIERFKPYAMGIAENGEQLSKILQSSKIVLGCHNQSTIQSRVFETFLSGGFFMNCYVEPNEDISDIRKFFKEDKEMVFFKTKQELIDKVKYYLENEEERKQMIKIGKEISLKEMTYTGLANRFLDYLRNYYKNPLENI